MSNRNYKIAKEYYNLQPGWVLHHKDVTLRHTDIDRYNEWRIEDLVPMTKSEHRKYHLSLDNPMYHKEYRDKVSAAMEKYKTIQRGTHCNLSEEEYHTIRSKITSSRNKTLWKDEEYANIMIELTHAPQRMQVLDKETKVVYKSLREAESITGISRYLIKTTDRFEVSERGGFRHD